jgi:SpoVK/Ycf46/Vps4 family AAA+-type ATPase
MNKIDFNKILNRENEIMLIKEMLYNFELKKKELNIVRGIYIYGETGCGKTHFINNILNEMNYDVITYDSSDVRNKQIINNITKNNLSDRNIFDLFENKKRKIAIIMDEIDGMNNGDKGGINSLIKLVRPKKTKKQMNEEIANVPIIIIGGVHINKKISELMKTTLNIRLYSPVDYQIIKILNNLFVNEATPNLNVIKDFINQDLRKLTLIYNIYVKNRTKFFNILNILSKKTIYKDPKDVIKDMFNECYSLKEHNKLNETDRTTISLLWHENIIDKLPINTHTSGKDMIDLYYKFLENYCFADYIDRITFQKQIWQFNEMSSLIKTMYNNKLYHENIINLVPSKKNIKNKNLLENDIKSTSNDIRFTKILTKYSTEYNNKIFLNELCIKMNLDIKDLLCYAESVYKNNDCDNIIKNNEELYNKLDIIRLEKFKNR